MAMKHQDDDRDDRPGHFQQRVVRGLAGRRVRPLVVADHDPQKQRQHEQADRRDDVEQQAMEILDARHHRRDRRLEVDLPGPWEFANAALAEAIRPASAPTPAPSFLRNIQQPRKGSSGRAKAPLPEDSLRRCTRRNPMKSLRPYATRRSQWPAHGGFTAPPAWPARPCPSPADAHIENGYGTMTARHAGGNMPRGRGAADRTPAGSKENRMADHDLFFHQDGPRPGPGPVPGRRIAQGRRRRRTVPGIPPERSVHASTTGG